MRELEQWPEEHCILRPFVGQNIHLAEEHPEEVSCQEDQQKQEDIHRNLRGLMGHCPEVRSLHREHRMLQS